MCSVLRLCTCQILLARQIFLAHHIFLQEGEELPPFFLVDAQVQGHGKLLLVLILSFILFSPAQVGDMSSDDEEQQKVSGGGGGGGGGEFIEYLKRREKEGATEKAPINSVMYRKNETQIIYMRVRGRRRGRQWEEGE